MSDFDFHQRDQIEWLDAIVREHDEAEARRKGLSEPLEEIEPWDYTAVRIGLTVVIVSFAIAIPGIWWWCKKAAALFTFLTA
jgi:hypothetical protein